MSSPEDTSHVSCCTTGVRERNTEAKAHEVGFWTRRGWWNGMKLGEGEGCDGGVDFGD